MRLAIIAGCLIAAVAITACGKSSKSSTSSSAATGTSTTAAAAPAKSQELELYNYRFDPKAVKGKPGQKVTLELKNEGSTEHNFKIDSQKQADADVEPGKTAAISVKIPTSGSVQFYCEYHKGLGMVGTVKAS